MLCAVAPAAPSSPPCSPDPFHSITTGRCSDERGHKYHSHHAVCLHSQIKPRRRGRETGGLRGLPLCCVVGTSQAGSVPFICLLISFSGCCCFRGTSHVVFLCLCETKLSTDVVCLAVQGALLSHPVSASVPCPPQGKVLCSSPVFLHLFIPGSYFSNAAVQRKTYCCLFWQLLEYGATPTPSTLCMRTFFFKRCGIFFYFFLFFSILA